MHRQRHKILFMVGLTVWLPGNQASQQRLIKNAASSIADLQRQASVNQL